MSLELHQNLPDMESAEEFIQSFLSEKAKLHLLMLQTGAPLYQKYFTSGYFKHYSGFLAKREASPEEFVSIELTEQTACVITSEPLGQNRGRYNLCISDGQWKISSKESECFICHGSGLRGDNVCNLCEGKGWKNYSQTTV